MFQFKRVLVPLDGSDFAETALEPALTIAEAMAADMVLFCVAQPIPRTRALREMPDVYNDVVAAAYREAEDYLHDLREKLPYEKISTEHRPGTEGVARQILDYATESAVDLIVMSSHGRSGIERWTRGSVAEKVLQGACCSTLIIRGQHDL
jgi:nucleotide-binding universal stress UspA family protein